MIGLKEGKGSGTNRTRVVNIREEDYDVYIGRAGRGMDGYFGNPFRLGAGMTRGATLLLQAPSVPRRHYQGVFGLIVGQIK